jgi:hypothetical protein
MSAVVLLLEYYVGHCLILSDIYGPTERFGCWLCPCHYVNIEANSERFRVLNNSQTNTTSDIV